MRKPEDSRSMDVCILSLALVAYVRAIKAPNVGIDYSHDLTLTIIDVDFINSSSNTGTTHTQNI
jgi:hypothetical protein